MCRNEDADVGGPVRESGEGKVESRGNLATEGFPVGINIAGPHGGSVALDPGIAGGGGNEDAFLARGGPLSLIDGSRCKERIFVRITSTAAESGAAGDEEIGLAAFGLGFGRVEPPGIDTDAEESVI